MRTPPFEFLVPLPYAPATRANNAHLPALTKTDIEVCERLGITHADFVKARESHRDRAVQSVRATSGEHVTEEELCERLGITHADFVKARESHRDRAVQSVRATSGDHVTVEEVCERLGITMAQFQATKQA
jgi:DNA-directed RNA polymerase specialized sigma subunit